MVGYSRCIDLGTGGVRALQKIQSRKLPGAINEKLLRDRGGSSLAGGSDLEKERFTRRRRFPKRSLFPGFLISTRSDNGTLGYGASRLWSCRFYDAECYLPFTV